MAPSVRFRRVKEPIGGRSVSEDGEIRALILHGSIATLEVRFDSGIGRSLHGERDLVLSAICELFCVDPPPAPAFNPAGQRVRITHKGPMLEYLDRPWRP